MSNSHSLKRTEEQSRPIAFARRPWVLAVVLSLLALVPRFLTLDDFFTVDESFHWVWRVMHFMRALEKERWANTNLTGHPGITTLWLGSLGRWVAFKAGVYGPEWYRGGVVYLAWLRLPLAVVNSISVGMGYLLLRRLLRTETALLAAVLWAGSPFLIAHSRLLHMDALLTSFMTLTILCLLVAIRPTPQAEQKHGVLSWGFLVASGIFAGLAFLTKAPSLVLFPLTGFLLLFFNTAPTLSHRIRTTILAYLIWLTCAIAIFWAGWPALWSVPSEAIGHIIEEIIANGGQPHPSGNYFLGKPVADPGLLFYPVVVIWRTSPLTLVGLLLLPWALRSPRYQNERTNVVAIVSVVVIFGLAMTLEPKKFDRYLLPIFPALQIAAAVGLMIVLDAKWRWWRWLTERLHTPLARFYALLGITGAVLVGINAWYHPYYLAYFNPLVGGGKSGQYVMLAGWGEGMEQVGAWLRTRPDLTRSPVVSWDQRTLEPFVPVRVVELSERNLAQPSSYTVLYSRGTQRTGDTAAMEYIEPSAPLYTLEMYGIDYAKVYQPIRPFDTPVNAIFGDMLHLRGFRQQLADGILTITPSWNVLQDGAGGLFCFVHVLDKDGNRVAQVDVPIDEGLFSQWQRGQQFGSPLPMPLPARLPSGTYTIALGVYHPDDWSRLLLRDGTRLPPDVDGAEVVVLGEVEIGDEG